MFIFGELFRDKSQVAVVCISVSPILGKEKKFAVLQRITLASKEY